MCNAHTSYHCLLPSDKTVTFRENYILDIFIKCMVTIATIYCIINLAIVQWWI